ncbi:hypothetical protein [Hominisplanchenecus sp.]|jgi:hypothetical protein|uniref:hypothetical protein n=1 Tax=Hominisplanchenecus sp. TaxID=3038130 RepID=UPI003992B97A
MPVEMTREKLDRYRKLLKEIPVLENELAELWLTEKGMGNSVILNGKNGSKKPESVVGFDYDRYDRRKEALQRKKEEARAIREWIEAIEDGQTRCVFRMFYVDGMTWERIASKTGHRGSPDYPRLYIRDAYLKKMKIK